MFTDIYKTYRM